MKAIGASTGIAMGKVYIKTSQLYIEKNTIADVEQELKKFNNAIEESRRQLQAVVKKTREKIGDKEAEIFEAHLLILEDPDIINKVVEKIKVEKVNASWAIKEVVAEFVRLFQDINDEYIKERILDLQDVANRMIENILGIRNFAFSKTSEPVIIAAEELTPSDMSNLTSDTVMGIITEMGGATSHTAIMSRVMGMPTIVGAEGLLKQIKNGDTIILDGQSGEYFINPDEDLTQYYIEKNRANMDEEKALEEYIGKKTVTKDGYEMNIGCNIGSPKDLTAVLKNDGEGIGLFRSEFLYMDRTSMPGEEEQFESYMAAAAGMQGKPVIIRTLDIGGDKQLPYLNFPKEENPFLGFRAIRYCLEETDLFRIQLRAILRASAYGNVKIMLPMISSVAEVRVAKQQLNQAMKELRNRNISFDENIELGIMIETPGAALISDKLANEVDFFSIGTNDLVQYTLAVDRMNSKVAHLYTPYHPAMLRLIKLIANSARKAGIWVGMCGEAAQDEYLAPVFMAMGIHELSVNPPMTLKIRRLINSLSKENMEKHLDSILELSAAQDVLEYIKSISR